MMFTSHLIIETGDARVISRRLYHHWRSRMTTQESEGRIVFAFSEQEQAVFVYDTQKLTVTLSTDTAESHEKLQTVVKNHVNRMAKQEFSETWQTA